MMGQLFSRSKTMSTFPLYDVEMTTSQITRALEYVSRELRRRRQHIHLVVSGDEALNCLVSKNRKTCRSLNILIATRLTQKSLGILARAVRKATKKFSLGANWINITNISTSNNTNSPSPSPSLPPNQQFCVDDLIHRSLIQNDVMFSSEGLTLVVVDHCYALKSSLAELSQSYRGAWSASLDGPLARLHHMVYASRGRPITRGYIRRCYPHLEVEDAILLRLNAEYESLFKTRGIVGVNDEYIGWRREGMAWSPEMEEYTRELALGLNRERRGTSIDSELTPVDMPERPVYNWEPECSEDIARIFAEKGLYN